MFPSTHDRILFFCVSLRHDAVQESDFIVKVHDMHGKPLVVVFAGRACNGVLDVARSERVLCVSVQLHHFVTTQRPWFKRMHALRLRSTSCIPVVQHAHFSTSCSNGRHDACKIATAKLLDELCSESFDEKMWSSCSNVANHARIHAPLRPDIITNSFHRQSSSFKNAECRTRNVSVA